MIINNNNTWIVDSSNQLEHQIVTRQQKKNDS